VKSLRKKNPWPIKHNRETPFVPRRVLKRSLFKETLLSSLIQTAHELETAIKDEMAQLSQKNTLIEICDECIQKIFELANTSPKMSVELHLRRYFYAIQILHIHIETQHLKAKDIENILGIAETSLQISGIKEGTSLAHLYEEIYNCRCNILLQTGKPLGARWELLLGKRFLSHDAVWTSSAMSETMAVFQMGYAFHAKYGFQKLIELNLDPSQNIFLKYQHIKACRLSGDINEADHFLSHLFAHHHFEGETLEMFLWEKKWISNASSKTIDSFFKKMLGSSREFPNEPYLTLVMLLVYAHKDGYEYLKKLPTVTTIRRRYDRKLTPTDKILIEILNLLANLYDTEIPLKVRLSNVTPLIDQVNLLHPEYQLLFFLGLGRWAYRNKQKGFAHIALNAYQDLSHRMSNYHNDDVLAMAHDMRNIESPLWYLNETLNQGENSSRALVVSRTIGRRFSVWMNYARLGFQMLSSERTAKEKAILFVETILKNFIEGSMVLTGPYAKSMQHISQYLAHILGIDHKYKNELIKLYASIPVSASIDLEKIFKEEFHKNLKDVFDEWEKRPFSGGSISQVFKARLKNGRFVVLKVRHPDIEKQAKHDWALFNRFLLPIGKLYNKGFTQENSDWLQQVFFQELDLSHETAMMIRFRDIFKDDREVIIPEPIVEYCSSRCITMEYVEGATIEHLIEFGSQDERDRVASIIYRFHVISSIGHNLHKEDYFFGNFRYTDSAVIFLDFGRILSFKPQSFRAHKRLLANIFNHPERDLPSHLRMFEQNIFGIYQEFVRYWETSKDPVPYLADFQGYIDRVTEIFFKEVGKDEVIKLEEFVELEGLFGLTFCMAKLRARLPWSKIMKNYLNLYESPDQDPMPDQIPQNF
jgi:hypothetical protein